MDTLHEDGVTVRKARKIQRQLQEIMIYFQIRMKLILMEGSKMNILKT